jgi:hypothetical protein
MKNIFSKPVEFEGLKTGYYGEPERVPVSRNPMEPGFTFREAIKSLLKKKIQWRLYHALF